MSTPTPLPAHPNLEFERKRAKARLRALKVQDPQSLTTLSEVQHQIALEYGFASWPKLVRYFGDLERQRRARVMRANHEPDFYERSARSFLAEHRRQSKSAGRALAAYVPRFYGRQLEEIFAATLTEEEARLAVARMNGYISWDVLLQQSRDQHLAYASSSDEAWKQARDAISNINVEQLQQLVDMNPHLLEVRDDGGGKRPSLLGIALAVERRMGRDSLRPIMDWFEDNGFDIQLTLNKQLYGRIGTDPATVQYLLERGANPNWITPSGIPILEHALIRYWNGQSVDALAERAHPRKALWIAAGIGDVEGVAGFLDRHGKPTPEARRIRPDFNAAGLTLTQQPDPDDEEILVEAFMVAMTNGRTRVLDYMITRGFPVNTMIYETPLINFAVGNSMVGAVESLVKGGADLDLKGRQPDMTARELARELFVQNAQDVAIRRVAELCGLNPDKIITER